VVEGLGREPEKSPRAKMGIEEQRQSPTASMSFSSMTGDNQSPMMSIVSFMEPIQLSCLASGEAGTATFGF